MSRFDVVSLVGYSPAVLALLASLAAGQDPTKDRPPITAANADRLRPIAELEDDPKIIKRGPGRGELTFVRWEKPVEIVDEAKFRSLRKFGEGRRFIHFTADRDGRRIAWSENNSRVVVQEVAGDKTIEIETGNPQPRAAFSPDGKLLATGGYGNQAKLWDAAGRLVRALDAGGKGGLWPVFSPDGKLLAVGNRNDQTRLFDVATGNLLHTLPRKMTQELAFSPDGKVLAAGYVEGEVALWDVATGKLLQSKASGAAEVYTLDWSRKGDVLVTAGRAGKIVLWEPRGLTKLHELEAPVWVINVRFTPDGSRLLSSGGSDGTGKRDRKVVIWAVPDRADK
jgi:WD40 repeat protein